MIDALAAASSGLAYGIAHGLGPDHCAALSSLLADRPTHRRAVQVGLRFGGGHALTLCSLAALAAASGALVPSTVERWAEVFGGVLLVGLGLFQIWGRPRPSSHGHPHAASFLGAAFALSGVRGLALALPPLLLMGHSLWSAALYSLGFGVGITGAMVAFGLAFATAHRSLSSVKGVALWAGRTAGLLSVLLGSYWIWSHLS